MALQQSSLNDLFSSKRNLEQKLIDAQIALDELNVEAAALKDKTQVPAGGHDWEALLASERRHVALLEADKRKLLSKAAESMSSIRGILSQRAKFMAAFSADTSTVTASGVGQATGLGSNQHAKE